MAIGIIWALCRRRLTPSCSKVGEERSMSMRACSTSAACSRIALRILAPITRGEFRVDVIRYTASANKSDKAPGRPSETATGRVEWVRLL